MSIINQTSFIGRDNELDSAANILNSKTCRLLTVMGSGGIGKTRFALQLVQRLQANFADGAYIVDLQRIDTPDLLVAAIAESLPINMTQHAHPLEQVLLYLQERQLLLFLDNFEHVLDRAEVLAALLDAAPKLTLLITSREALRLQEEHRFMLAGLDVPAPKSTESELRASSSVTLFLDRARQVRHDFDGNLSQIASICRLVNGTPLAIELAAVWVQVLDVGEIAHEIQTCMDFLETDMRNVPARHRSIRAVFHGSWERLNADEQRTLMCLSVFQSSFDRSSAEAVAETRLQTLFSLHDKSLLYITADGRYSLHELIRQYALEELEANDEECLRTYQAHSQHYAKCTQYFGDGLRGSEQIVIMKQFQQDLQNMRSGWLYAVAHADEALMQHYILGLMLYYQMRSRTAEALVLLTPTDAQFMTLSTNMRGQIQLLRGWLLIMLWRNVEGVEATWQALKILQSDYPAWTCMAIVPALNHPELLAERYQDIIELVNEVLPQIQNTWQKAWWLKASGEISFIAHDYPIASTVLKKSSELFHQIGDGWGASWANGNLGVALVEQGRYLEAENYYRQNIEICQEIGDISGLVDTLNKLAQVTLLQTNYAEAEAIIQTSLETSMMHSASAGVLTYLLDTLATVRLAQKRLPEVVALLTTLRQSSLVQHGWRESEIIELDSRIDTLRSQLDPTAFELARQRGHTMTLAKVAQNARTTNSRPVKMLAQSTKLIESLTERELEILRLIVVGYSNREIAETLTISIGTVKTHSHNIYGKLGASNRTEASAYARDLNLV